MIKLMMAFCLATLVLMANSFAENPKSREPARLKIVHVANATIVKHESGITWDYVLLDIEGDGKYDDFVSHKRGVDLMPDKPGSTWLLTVLLIEETVSSVGTPRDIFVVYLIHDIRIGMQ